MVPAYLEIGEVLLDASGKENEAACQTPSCGPGCGACCRQLVPISSSEGAYLRKIVLPGLDEDHRERVEERITAAAEKLEAEGMADVLAQLPTETDPQQRQNVGLRYFFLGIPCPFLEEDSCSIHPRRPLACREYLVSSPAACCASPVAGEVVPIVPKVKPSAALIRLDREASGGGGWITMISALISEIPAEERKVREPEKELRFFLSQLGRD